MGCLTEGSFTKMKEIIIGYNDKPGVADPLWTAWEQTGEIVRCKDCKYNNPVGCDKHNVIVSDSFFCAYGERKDE